jgi:hypothetical protein
MGLFSKIKITTSRNQNSSGGVMTAKCPERLMVSYHTATGALFAERDGVNETIYSDLVSAAAKSFLRVRSSYFQQELDQPLSRFLTGRKLLEALIDNQVPVPASLSHEVENGKFRFVSEGSPWEIDLNLKQVLDHVLEQGWAPFNFYIHKLVLHAQKRMKNPPSETGFNILKRLTESEESSPDEEITALSMAHRTCDAMVSDHDLELLGKHRRQCCAVLEPINGGTDLMEVLEQKFFGIDRKGLDRYLGINSASDKTERPFLGANLDNLNAATIYVFAYPYGKAMIDTAVERWIVTGAVFSSPFAERFISEAKGRHSLYVEKESPRCELSPNRCFDVRFREVNKAFQIILDGSAVQAILDQNSFRAQQYLTEIDARLKEVCQQSGISWKR